MIRLAIFILVMVLGLGAISVASAHGEYRSSSTPWFLTALWVFMLHAML